jgi:23S rRNA (adenine2503-C2)-methyltransferase
VIYENLLSASRQRSFTRCLGPLQGMGEPLHNLDAVRRAVSILCHPRGLQFSPKKVTVSTVGLVPEIRALAGSCPAQLAVSLHATTDEVRDWIAPVNRR